MNTNQELINTLKDRFEQNLARHQNLVWASVQAKLEKNPEKLWSLHEMERTGGEPDVIYYEPKSKAYVFVDCSPESPSGRRNLCFDRAGQAARKTGKPAGNALDLATAMGIELLTETDYRALQQLGEFDTKTSSWLLTPHQIRQLGGALFADRRYGQVFVYHNSAPSYYASRAFRGSLSL